MVLLCYGILVGCRKELVNLLAKTWRKLQLIIIIGSWSSEQRLLKLWSDWLAGVRQLKDCTTNKMYYLPPRTHNLDKSSKWVRNRQAFTFHSKDMAFPPMPIEMLDTRSELESQMLRHLNNRLTCLEGQLTRKGPLEIVPESNFDWLCILSGVPAKSIVIAVPFAPIGCCGASVYVGGEMFP